ncbi:MAG: trypsin-like peptidase domain-containing protein [Chloroflexi bacterium]|nr:trypsin-like peptidase domain-containing protein [Chloroflexota bacterium]
MKVTVYVRVILAALIAWPLVILGTVAAMFLASDADLDVSAGFGRRRLAISPPTPPPAALASVVPVEAAGVPWSVRLSRPYGPVGTSTLVTWAGRRSLVTASHVVSFWPYFAWIPQPEPVFRHAIDGTASALPWGRINYPWDLAIFPVPEDATPALELREDAPALGERVRFVGHPFAVAGPAAAAGPVVVVTPHPSGTGAAAVVAAIEASDGQSGGALVDEQGRLVGIGVARTPWGVLAAGNGAVAATLAAPERLPSAEPPPAIAWLAVLAAVPVAATALIVALDRGLRRLARTRSRALLRRGARAVLRQ